jgi:hypothetical protein
LFLYFPTIFVAHGSMLTFLCAFFASIFFTVMVMEGGKLSEIKLKLSDETPESKTSAIM